MDDTLYLVRVTGLATTQFPPPQITSSFARIFCLTIPEAESRLANLPLVVRGNLSHDHAEKYRRVLMRLGVECEIGLQPLPEDASPRLAASLGEGA